MLDIARIDKCQLTPELCLGREPLLISDGATGWSAFQQWTPDRIGKMAVGRVDVSVSLASFRLNPDGSPADPNHQFILPNVDFGQATKEVLRSHGTESKCYISQQDLSARLPELLKHIGAVWPERNAITNLWFGSAGIITPLHYDSLPNAFAQIYGVKRFTIFAPEDTQYLYPYPESAKMRHVSWVDVEKPDMTRFPDLCYATPYSFEIHPGELLILPPFWWHHVESLTTSISVNQWSTFGPELSQCRGERGAMWARFQYARDQWKKFRIDARLSLNDLIDYCESMSNESPLVSLFALSVAVEELQASGAPVETIYDSEKISQLKECAQQCGALADCVKSPSFEALHSSLFSSLFRLKALVKALAISATEQPRHERLGLVKPLL